MQAYCKILVTSDPDVAKIFSTSGIDNFSKNYLSGRTNRVGMAKNLYSTLTKEQKNSLLVDPYDNDSFSRLISAEFSLGYGDAATENNFKFKMSLVDFTGDLEILFLNNLLDIQRFSRNLNDYVAQLNDEQRLELGRSRLAGTPQLNGLNSNQALLTRTFYFVFINKDETFLPAIASQYLKATVDEAPSNYFGNRVLLLEFITTGHPNISSHLADITKQKSLYVAESIFKDVETRKFEIEVDWNFEDLSKDPVALDASIKKTIRDLFKQACDGKEIILLLPDFGKIYTKFKNSLSRSLVKSAIDALTNSFDFKFNADLLNDYVELKQFLNQIGFTFVENYIIKNIYEATNKLSAADVQSLSKLRKALDNIISNIESASTQYDWFNATRLININLLEQQGRLFNSDFDASFNKQDQEYLLNNNLLNLSEQYIGGYTVYDVPGEGLIEKLITLTKSTNTISRGGFTKYVLGSRRDITLQERKKILIGILNEIYLIKYEKALRAVSTDPSFNLLENFRAANQLTSASQFTAAQAGVDPTSLTKYKVSFFIDSNEPNKSGAVKAPNMIDFNEFLNNFSIKVGSVAGNNFIFRFSEEFDLSRLEILNKTCKYIDYDFKTKSKTKTPLISNTTMPAIVIYEDWILNNLYAPVEGFVDNRKLKDYPISDIDIENYNTGSDYNNYLYLDKVIHGFDYSGIMLPFSELERPSKFWGIIFPNPTTNGDALYQAVTKESTLPKELNISSTRSFPVFIYKPTEGNSTNIITWNLIADTTNSFVSYNSYIRETANVLIDDSLVSATLPAIIDLIGDQKVLDDAKTEIKRFMTTYDSNILESVKNKISDAIKINNPNYGTVDSLNIIGTSEQKNQYSELLSLKQKSNKTDEETRREQDLAQTLQQSAQQQQEVFVGNIINDLLQNYLYGRDEKGVIEFVKTYMTQTSSVYSKALRKFHINNHLFNKIYTLTVKTPPYFQLSNLYTLNTPVYVLLYKNYMNLGSKYFGIVNSSLPDSVTRPSVLSGFYQIIGFKHVMQFKQFQGPQSYSEFTLRKNINFGSV